MLSGIPRWTTTKGALYCFLPGIGGLRYLGKRGWESDAATPSYTPTLGATAPATPA